MKVFDVGRTGLTAVLVAGSVAFVPACTVERDSLMPQVGDFVFRITLPATTGAGLPSGSTTINQTVTTPTGVRAAQLTISINELAPLSGGVYQAWLWSFETGEIVPAVGVYNTLSGGVAIDTFITSTFNGGPGLRHRIVVHDSTLTSPSDSVGFFTHVIVTIQAAGDVVPSAAKFLSAQYADQKGTPDDYSDDTRTSPATQRFGTFSTQEKKELLRYAVSGSGQGGYWGDEVRVEIRNLTAPPVGFFYEGWLREASSSASLGSIVAPVEAGYASLRDLDTDPALAQFVVEGKLVKSVQRSFASELGINFYDYTDHYLVLAPKLRANSLPPGIVLAGFVPEGVRARRPSE